MEIFSMGYALLAIQNALLRVVTLQLRAVIVDVCKKRNLLYIRFFYDRKAPEKLIELWECAITEASADLGPDCFVDSEIERLDYPQEIPRCGRYAYLRKEPSQSITPISSEASMPYGGRLSEVNSSQPKQKTIARKMIDFQKPVGTFICPVSGEQMSTSLAVFDETKEGNPLIFAKPPTYAIPILAIAYALLATQRALLGTITPELRAVTVDVDQQNSLLYLRFYYDGYGNKTTIALWESAITKVYADLGPNYALDAHVEQLDYPQTVPLRGRYAYLRKESS